ncbi:hypothetical protein [Gordonia sp. SL306]|uniref:hypothetical protein n=1 Tax=Gordonia sp. SL306 TaxID=2995145 RepID=UPI00226D8489|nr:hypothetical protein [Gordonia sp. SL306]WAC57196.1 hypothetical protein OVA31_08140 [Gordonia sp. SL306]
MSVIPDRIEALFEFWPDLTAAEVVGRARERGHRLDVGTLSAVRSGHIVHPSVETVIAIAAGFGVTPEYFAEAGETPASGDEIRTARLDVDHDLWMMAVAIARLPPDRRDSVLELLDFLETTDHPLARPASPDHDERRRGNS